MLDEINKIYYTPKGIVDLTTKETKFLLLLIEEKGKVVTYTALAENIYGKYSENVRRCLHQIAFKINKKLKGELEIFGRVSIGYRLEYIGGETDDKSRQNV